MQVHPVIERYLRRFETAFDEFEVADRTEIVEELRNHIAEARAAGKPLDGVLEALGSADVLARAYAVELALHPRDPADNGARAGVLSAARAAGARRVRAVVRVPRAGAAFLLGGVRSVFRLLMALLGWGVARLRALGRVGARLVIGGLRRVRRVGRLLRDLVVAAPRSAWHVGVRMPSLAMAGLRRVWSLASALKSAVLLAGVCLTAAVVAAGIGVVGIGVMVTGFLLLGTGIVDISGTTWIDLPASGIPPAVAMALGPMLMAAGAGGLLLFRVYATFVGNVLTRAFPHARVAMLARRLSGLVGGRQAEPVASPASSYR